MPKDTSGKKQELEKEQELIKQILKKQHQAEKERENYEGIWDDVADFGVSRRAGFVTKLQEGKRRGSKIYDGTPASALKLWVDGIQGYYISRALEWFNYRIAGRGLEFLNENDDVRFWLQMVKELVYWELNESNFYDSIREFLLDGGSVGNANMFINEDIAEDRLYFQVYHPRECWFFENKHGNVDIVHRKFDMTGRQAMQEFDEKKLSENVRNSVKTNRHQDFEFLQAIYPVDDPLVKQFDSGTKRNQFRNYVSYYIEVDKKRLLRRGQFRTMNPVVWRLQKYSGETYGRGLLGEAIVDVKRLNSASKSEMMARQLAIEPPFNVPMEMRDDVDLTPHGMNYYRDAQRIIAPVNVGANYPSGDEYIKRLQDALERHFQIEFFLLLARSDRTMTATEVIEKQGEKVALMSSQLSQLSRVLNNIHNRILNILFLAGKIPPPPPILIQSAGGFFNIEVDYVGPLPEAQKRLFKARGIRQSLEVAAPYVQMFPGILDRVDDDELAKELFITHGMPAKVMRNDDEVAQIRQQRAQQQQQMLQAELLEKQSKAVQKLQKPVEENSIVEQLTKGT